MEGDEDVMYIVLGVVGSEAASEHLLISAVVVFMDDWDELIPLWLLCGDVVARMIFLRASLVWLCC